jgi:hypothetical protein
VGTQHRNARLLIATVALLFLAWAVATLWFGWPALSQVSLQINAFALIFLWALGPPVWFLIEGQIWKSEPGLEQVQRHCRDFWLGAGAIVVLLAARGLSVTQAQPLSRYVVAWNLVVDTVRVMAWPTVAIFGFFLFREPVSAFFNALGTRASKIGAFNVSIELTSLPEARPWSGPMLDDLRSESPAAAADSSRSLFRAIADTTPADYVTVDLEDGKAWLTSRLFILAALLPRVRPIKRIVFLGGPAGSFVGESTPAFVVEALAQKYNWLEEAYINAHVFTAGQEVQLNQGFTLLGRLYPELADGVLNRFLFTVKKYVAPGTENTPAAAGWERFGNVDEHAEWVTVASLTQLLGRNLNLNAVKRDPSAGEVTVARTLLLHDSHYVAVVDGSDRFQHLIDRYAAMDKVVRREMAVAH